jgi:hypothetical protein
LPKQFTNYVENENYREPSVAVHASEQVMLNTSMPFMSYVSKSGLATPRLLCRQPLASIARKMTPVYKPPYSNMDLGANTPLLDAIYMQFDKVDFDAFIDNWEKDHAEIPSIFEHRGWPRFHDMSIQLMSPDVSKRGRKGNYSVDLELNNSVMVAAFFGPWSCMYCDEVVIMRGIMTAVEHLSAKHVRLMTSFFSCPTCLQTVICTWDSFMEHYQSYHEMAESLCVTLDATCTHSRIGWGMAMVAWMTAVNSLGILRCQLSHEGEEENHRGKWGGYAPIEDERNCEGLSTALDAIKESWIPKAEGLRRIKAKQQRRKEEAERQAAEERLQRSRAEFAARRSQEVKVEDDPLEVPDPDGPDVIVEDEPWVVQCMRENLKYKRKKASRGGASSFNTALFPPLPDPERPSGADGASGSKEPVAGPSGAQQKKSTETDTDSESSQRKSKKKKKSFEYQEGMQKEPNASGQWKYPEPDPKEGYRTRPDDQPPEAGGRNMDVDDEFATNETEPEPEKSRKKYDEEDLLDKED